MKNKYIENIKEIIALAKEHNCDWSVAVDHYDNKHGTDGKTSEEISAERAEFYEYVGTDAFDSEGHRL